MVNRESITHNPHNKTSVSQSVTKGSSRDASASKNFFCPRQLFQFVQIRNRNTSVLLDCFYLSKNVAVFSCFNLSKTAALFQSCFNLSKLGRFILWQAVRSLSLSEIYAQPLRLHLRFFVLLYTHICL